LIQPVVAGQVCTDLFVKRLFCGRGYKKICHQYWITGF
jgi:hypothetical protein